MPSDEKLSLCYGNLVHANLEWLVIGKSDSQSSNTTTQELARLVEIVRALRDPKSGCPWDLEQTHQSLIHYMREEAYEFISAAEKGDAHEMADELGDVLLQVVLHSQIASESKSFDLAQVARTISEKMIRRHPHVFDNKQNTSITTAEVKSNWAKIKEQEGPKASYEIGEKYLRYPALLSAHKIGAKTKELNFDWEDPAQVAYKVEEEWQELKEEITSFPQSNLDRVREEMGDFLFSAAQLARHLGLDPEECLARANKKFVGRFNQVEDLIKEKDLKFQDLTQRELDHYWDAVKMREKKWSHLRRRQASFQLNASMAYPNHSLVLPAALPPVKVRSVKS